MAGNILFQNNQQQSQGPTRGTHYGMGSPPTIPAGSDQLQFYSSNFGIDPKMKPIFNKQIRPKVDIGIVYKELE
jgi:hypothetical protein